MSSNQLKILACIFMLIDHIGAILYGDVLILRIIGRLAFPMFVFFIVEGFTKTRDLTMYFGRLFTFAIVSQFAFSYAFNTSSLNVLYTLALGLFAIYIYSKTNNFIYVLLLGVLAQVADTDYGIFGVILIFLFYIYKDNFKKLTLSFLVAVLAFELAVVLMSLDSIKSWKDFVFEPAFYEPVCLFSLFFVRIYNHKRGANLKYLFYIFYPLHLYVLKLIEVYLF